jgi:hypothetical protein
MADTARRLGEETVPPDEGRYTDQLTAMLLAKVERDYPTGPTRRDAHAKHHGCVRAEFIVESILPPELRVGLFARPRTFPALVRFSNQDGVPRPDADKDIRGMAIKLLGVEGEKLLDDEKDTTTQDFILISTPVFVTKDVAEFHDLIAATVAGRGHLIWYFLNPFNSHLRVMRNLWSSLRRHANPLEVHYWSTTPYKFGDGAVKYSARPVAPPADAVPANPGPDYLREAMARSLARGDVWFDFLVQLQTDPRHMPIEDPGVAWSEARSPFRKVAAVRIPAQTFDTPERMALAENLSFTPWHCLPEHRPLGGINRARKVAYRAVSEFRHRRNGVPRKEPDGLPPA